MHRLQLPASRTLAGAAACWGSYTAFSALLLRRYSPTIVVAWTSVGAGAWAAVAYSALFVAAFGFLPGRGE